MSDQAEALTAHNQAREAASVHGQRPDLVWDQNLVNDAQQWANHMASIEDLVHSGDTNGEGESIAFYAGTNATPSLMGGVSQWLGEIGRYNGEKIGETGPGGTYEDWGHYTQAIWPTTTNVGVAVAQSASGKFFVCGRYTPAGNVGGQSAWTAGPSPPAQGGGIVYLVNSTKNGQWTSGFANYNTAGGNDGHQPDQYIDINKSSSVTWEGGRFSGTFQNGQTFNVQVNADAAAQGFGAQVGSAQSTLRPWKIFRDNFRVLYEIDGWQVHPVYWCT